MIVTCSSFFTDPPNLIAIARILFDSSESDPVQRLADRFTTALEDRLQLFPDFCVC